MNHLIRLSERELQLFSFLDMLQINVEKLEPGKS
jgi:hypothetical protein